MDATAAQAAPDVHPSPPPAGGALAAPFPWFGAKRRVADEVWRRLGDPRVYVEPFAGTAAALLARPDSHHWWDRHETINDADGLLANFFRALAADPDQVVRHADWPVNEADLTARHLWLTQHRVSLTDRLLADPDFYDPKAAGWWVWGVSAWVGGDWCTGVGPYTGGAEPSRSNGGVAEGVYRKMPMVAGGHRGRGVHRPRPVTGRVLALGGGIVPAVATSTRRALTGEFTALANRLRRVRVTCGNWDRLLGEALAPPPGQVTGVFLDPPYDPTLRRADLYAVGDRPGDREEPVHAAARRWALEHTTDRSLRIAYCAYTDPAGDRDFLAAGWRPHRWTAAGGYGLSAHNRARANRTREVVWFSPTCLTPMEAPALFDPADLQGPQP